MLKIKLASTCSLKTNKKINEMKEYVVTLDCNGLRKQIKIFANSEIDARIKAQNQNSNCIIIDCFEYIKS